MKKRKDKITTVQKIEYLLSKLTREYSPEKTDDDYRKLVQGMTNNSELADLTLKAWEKALMNLEGEK